MTTSVRHKFTMWKGEGDYRVILTEREGAGASVTLSNSGIPTTTLHFEWHETERARAVAEFVAAAGHMRRV